MPPCSSATVCPPGPDFKQVDHTRDMPAYQPLTQRLLTNDANVRNVKALFPI